MPIAMAYLRRRAKARGTASRDVMPRDSSPGHPLRVPSLSAKCGGGSLSRFRPPMAHVHLGTGGMNSALGGPSENPGMNSGASDRIRHICSAESPDCCLRTTICGIYRHLRYLRFCHPAAALAATIRPQSETRANRRLRLTRLVATTPLSAISPGAPACGSAVASAFLSLSRSPRRHHPAAVGGPGRPQSTSALSPQTAPGWRSCALPAR